MASDRPVPYGIGSDTWPGLSRLAADAAQVAAAARAIISTGNDTGQDAAVQRESLQEQLGDLRAAIDYVIGKNALDWAAVNRRRDRKRSLYERGIDEDRPPSPAPARPPGTAGPVRVPGPPAAGPGRRPGLTAVPIAAVSPVGQIPTAATGSPLGAASCEPVSGDAARRFTDWARRLAVWPTPPIDSHLWATPPISVRCGRGNEGCTRGTGRTGR